MTPHHHPSEEFLLDYASGAATEPFALLVAAHLACCPACRAIVAEAEAIGGALLEDLPADAAAASLDQDVNAILARAARQAADRRRAPASTLAGPLRDYVADLETAPWRALGPGIHHCVLAKDRHGAAARLLRIAPGRSVFEHSHSGTELTLVLKGGYRAGGTHFQAGDVECADESTSHRPVADADGTCICLAVTDAPLRFRNLLGRAMQTFIRI
jgi:putative transcriptional regulator